jgi:hypothetical protein
VQTALTALSTIGSGNVAVTGSAGGPYTVTFQGALANSPEPLLTGNSSALTPSGTVTVANTTTGVAPVTVTASLQGFTAACTVTVTP